MCRKPIQKSSAVACVLKDSPWWTKSFAWPFCKRGSKEWLISLNQRTISAGLLELIYVVLMQYSVLQMYKPL